ncbi:MAG: PEP-CTERM sorting domain-containing protein [Planctomycetia bacterium]|nr:PEP-CTERM sorting domain-containing protein [Planctomycetia bacterium]
MPSFVDNSSNSLSHNVARYALTLMVMFQAAGASAAKPFFTGLGMLRPDSINSGAVGVSADGSVVVGFASTTSSEQAFRWTLSEGMQGLGFFPGADSSYANKVSDNGTIVGAGISANGLQGFIWTPEYGFEGIGFVPGVDTASYAYTISGDGNTVVGNALNSDFKYEAIRWTKEEGIVLMGDLPGGEFGSGAVGVSQDGSVALGYGTSSEGLQMAIWAPDQGLVGLGDAPPSDLFGNVPTDLSADGTTAVGYAPFSGAFGTYLKAIRWTHEAGFLDLGQLPEGYENVAWSVSGGWFCNCWRSKFSPGTVHFGVSVDRATRYPAAPRTLGNPLVAGGQPFWVDTNTCGRRFNRR